jgi:hypothetical protein
MIICFLSNINFEEDFLQTDGYNHLFLEFR